MSSNNNICFFCNKIDSTLNIFSCCSHRICNLCLYERIFSNHIHEFQGHIKLKIKCKCEIGYLDKKLSEILNLIKEKNYLDEIEKEENISDNPKIIMEGCECSNENKVDGKKFSEFFCLDCYKFICKKCKDDIKNIHSKHRIIDSKHLIRLIKDNIRKIKLNNETIDSFEEKCNNLSKKFEDIIDNNFNNTVKKIDDLIDRIKNLKEFYIQKYKYELGMCLAAFKCIKLFYINFYKDKTNELKIIQAEKCNIYKLKYLNNISYEFIDMKINHSQLIDREISQITKSIENLQNPENKNRFISGKFFFQEIKKGFKMGESFQAHKKYINSLIVTKNNKIITASNDYHMKVWDPNKAKIAKQDEKEKINNLFSLKNGKILASKDNNILIFELNNENKYIVSQSMTNHNKNISAIAELDDGTIISAGSDKKIILWEENPNNKQYKVKQVITTEKDIQIILPLNDFKISYAGNDDGIINILGAKTYFNNDKIIKSKEFSEICKLTKLKGKVNCICKLNQDFFVSGGGDNYVENKLDHNIYIWKPFKDKYSVSQILFDAHQADVNSIILLRDGRFASSSKDRTIKIWKKYKKKLDSNINFILSQTLSEYNHGLYKLIQLDDDRIISSTSTNLLVFWNNTNSIF